MRKFVSIFLITLLLFGSLRVSVATHFCGGLAVKQAFMVGHHTLDCGMPEMDESRNLGTGIGPIIQAEACCENEFQNFEIDNQFRPVASQDTPDVGFFVAFIIATLSPQYFAVQQPEYADYNPPPIYRDIPVINQSFLI